MITIVELCVHYKSAKSVVYIELNKGQTGTNHGKPVSQSVTYHLPLTNYHLPTITKLFKMT